MRREKILSLFPDIGSLSQNAATIVYGTEIIRRPTYTENGLIVRPLYFPGIFFGTTPARLII
jgi:hypothetical protein